jgi:K(+)-stimulated pyrophosphate-energized sodium pump
VSKLTFLDFLDMQSLLFSLVPISACISLGFAWYFFRQMMSEDEGTDLMRRIASHVKAGARAYLVQQYKLVAIVFFVIMMIFMWLAYGLHVQNAWVPFAFLTGGLFSGLAGWFGMYTATQAGSRTAHAAKQSLDHGLKVAFRSGAVMGLVVVGLGLLDISIWYGILNFFVDVEGSQKLIIITTTMLTFGMGASLQALFARVGGGIFTKAADVGADLVGKVEVGIPEDDPRNPATIADNVGDNVGDVAGMGADLYESYCGSILATAALGAAAFAGSEQQAAGVIAPMLIGALGTILSILGVLSVRTREGADMKELMAALNRGIHLAGIGIVIFSFIILKLLGLDNALGLWGSIVVGLLTGIGIGKATEYYTSHAYKPTQRIAEMSKTGPATVIIGGMGEGFISTVYPVLMVVGGTVLAYVFAAGDCSFDGASMGMGLYGIGIAAVGMLSTLGITLATDAYGPIADNAGGNAEMSGLSPEVRQRTDALDSLGNTTAATGKGFAIGSAALTALALLASYVEELKIAMHHIEPERLAIVLDQLGVSSLEVIEKAHLPEFMQFYEVNLMNPKVILGAFIGSMMAFVFCGLSMNAVGRAAGKMVDEVRRQFKDIPGILDGNAEPDYARCVQISTKAAQREMLLPSSLTILVPITVGLLFGVPGVFGLLAGSLTTGFSLAVMMANSGGAWDNAKKYIEEGNLGGKGSPAHKAAVIGDTVGDPFKDTAGPSLNILIKLMTMVSIATAGLNISFTLL